MLIQTNPYAPSKLGYNGNTSLFGLTYAPALTYKSSDLVSYELVHAEADHRLDIYKYGVSFNRTSDGQMGKVGTLTFTVPDAAAVKADGTDGVYRIKNIAIVPNATMQNECGVTVSGYQSAIGIAASQYAVDVTVPSGLAIQWQDLIAVYDGTDKKPDVSAFTGVKTGDDVTVSVSEAGEYPVTASLGGANKGFYAITNPTAVLTIQRAPVIFTVSDDQAKADGSAHYATVAAVAAGAFSDADYTVSYRPGGTEVSEPKDAGSYDIYAEITDSNYRHSDASVGSAKKIGVLTIYDAAPKPTYAFTFEANGGEGTMTQPQAAQKDALRVFPACGFAPAAGYKFAGWSCAGRVYQPGDTFVQPAADVTDKAQWQAVYQIGGNVTQAADPTAVAAPDTVITLMLGSEQIAQCVTDAAGDYSFDNVVPGLYNLVAVRDGITRTIAVEITTVSQSEKNIVLPAMPTNSIVKVTEGTLAIVVGDLDKTFEADSIYTGGDKQVVNDGGAVDIKLTAAVTDTAPDIEQLKDEAADNDTIALFIDVKMTKTVINADGSVDETLSCNIPETEELITFTIMLPAGLQGKVNYVVCRTHNDLPESLTTEKNAAGEYITVNPEKTIITVHAKKFSVYGVGYGVSEITFDANGGSCATATLTTDGDGILAMLPEASRTGEYTFDGWFTEKTGGTKVDIARVYESDATLYAHWTAVKKDIPNTGDAGVLLYAGMGLVSALGAVLAGRRRRNKDR